MKKIKKLPQEEQTLYKMNKVQELVDLINSGDVPWYERRPMAMRVGLTINFIW